MTRFSLLVVAALAGVLLFVAAPAQAGPPSVIKFPLSFSLFDSCTNENIDLSGNLLLVLDTTPGDGHAVFHSVDVHVTGVGETTGASYIEHFISTQAQQGNVATGPYTETDVIHVSMIAPGGGSDFESEAVIHVTINANGVITVFSDSGTGKCV